MLFGLSGLKGKSEHPETTGATISPEVEYTYDVLDRLTETRRGDLTTTLTYDMAGRKTSMSDPDMGLDVSIRCPRQSDYPGECETSGDQPVLRYT